MDLNHPSPSYLEHERDAVPPNSRATLEARLGTEALVEAKHEPESKS